MKCPKCGHEQDPKESCARCGVVFAKWGRPPAPRRAGAELLDAEEPALARLLGSRRLTVEQNARHWWEILLNWEQRNEYAITSADRGLVGYLVEQGTGLKAALARVFLGSHRSIEVALLSTGGELLLEFHRPFFWILSEMEVRTVAGDRVGRVLRRWAWTRRRYELSDSRGRIFATIESPLLKIWTFPVVDPSGVERARISKKWSGLLKEAYTDADNFGVDLGEHPWTPTERMVIIAATVAIDFDFFENNQQR